jgi:hypothetical protein
MECHRPQVRRDGATIKRPATSNPLATACGGLGKFG